MYKQCTLLVQINNNIGHKFRIHKILIKIVLLDFILLV